MERALVVLILVSAAFAVPPAGAVSDDAFLAIDSLGLWTVATQDKAYRSEVAILLTATSDAPAGHYAGNVSLEARDIDDPGRVVETSLPYSVDVSGSGAEPFEQMQVRSNWTLPRGLYNVSTTLHPDGGDEAWDSQWVWHAVGRAYTLGHGWGFELYPEAASFDVDGDGEDDIWLADNATGEPLARPLDLYEGIRHGSLVPEWSSECGRSFSLSLGGMDAPPTDIRVATSLVDFLAPGDTPLRLNTQAYGGPPPAPRDGAYKVTLGTQYFGTRSDSMFFSHDCVQPEKPPNVWGHGFRTVANVTHWDLDEDGTMDVRYWETDSATPEEARNETVEERRSTELVLIAQATVEQRTTLRRLTFDLSRPGGGHEGAWLEINDAERLFRALLQPDANATLSYQLSLPSNESFIEHDGNTTWAWIGHFSVQSLTVIFGQQAASVTVPFPLPDGDEPTRSRTPPPPVTTEPPRSNPGIPALAPLVLAAMLLLVARSRHR